MAVRGCDFAVRKTTFPITLIPHNSPGEEVGLEIVASPHNVLFAYPEKFCKIFRSRNFPIGRYVITTMNSNLAFLRPIIPALFRPAEIRRVYNRQVEKLVRYGSHIIHTVNVVRDVQTSSPQQSHPVTLSRAKSSILGTSPISSTMRSLVSFGLAECLLQTLPGTRGRAAFHSGRLGGDSGLCSSPPSPHASGAGCPA